MKPTQTKSSIKVEVLKEKHAKPAIELFVKSFCESEPITKHIGVTPKEYTAFATQVVEKAVKDGLSKIVLDENNHVIGLVIAEDMADPFKPTLNQYPKLKPIQAFLEALSKPFTEGRHFKKGKILHTWVAAIDPQFRSQGLYKELGLIHVESASKEGFDFIYSDFTNEISEKIVKQFEKLRLCNKLNYTDFTFESKKPFAGLQGGAASYITALRPDVTFDSISNCFTKTEKTRT